MSTAQVQLVPLSGPAAFGEEEASGPQNVRVMRGLEALRRHWAWAVPLALVLAVSGVVVGYSMVTLDYRSTGSILVKPVLPRVLYQTEETDVMPMFGAYLQSQMAVIRSQRVVDLAMQSPLWKDLGRGSGPDQARELLENMEVSSPRDSGIIMVSVIDEDARGAAATTKAIVQAYERIYAELDNSQSAQTMRLLEARSATLAAELRSLNERVFEIANEFGSTTLERIYDFRLTELAKLESELQQLQVAIALAGGGGDVPDDDSKPLDAEAIARVDPQMARLVAQRNEATRELQLLQVRLLPNHRQVMTAQREIELYEQEIAKYATEFRTQLALSRATDGKVAPSPIAATSNLEQLREREGGLTTMVERARAQTLELGRKRLQIDALQRDITETETRLAETRARIEQLSVQSGIGGRIEILSYGDVANEPYRDKRKQAVVFGGGTGAMIGLAPALLLGLLDRRCRSLSDARRTTRRVEKLLGIVPTFVSGSSDPDEAATTAHYVHQIRARLQMGAGARSKAYAITSSGSGSGKTSLALALGLSFASSGERTLLVDCDIIGGGLTRRLQPSIHRKLGQTLLRQHAITPDQLEEAVGQAHSNGHRLGETLVALGFVTQEQLDEALSAQAGTHLGLAEALAGEPLDECVSEFFPKMHVLPLGSASEQHIGELSPASLGRVLERARQEYDVILVDTGPVPGSIEASMLASQVDEIVMVIARGEERAAAEHALDYLLSLGGKVAGIVFNRADTADVRSSGYYSQARSHHDEDEPQRSAPRLGAIAEALSVSSCDGRKHAKVYV